MHARVYAARRCKNLIVYSLPSHKDAVVAVFFERDSLDVRLKCCCRFSHLNEIQHWVIECFQWLQRGIECSAGVCQIFSTSQEIGWEEHLQSDLFLCRVEHKTLILSQRCLSEHFCHM